MEVNPYNADKLTLFKLMAHVFVKAVLVKTVFVKTAPLKPVFGKLLVAKLLKTNLAALLCGLLCIAAASYAPASYAQEYDANDKLLSASNIQQETLAWAEQTQAFAQPNVRIELSAGKMDDRLSFSACDLPLTFEAATQSARAARALVKVRCTGAKPWAIFVPLEVSRYKHVVIVNQPLTRGTQLSPAELSIKEIALKLPTTDAFEKIEDASGMLLKRNLNAGEVVRAMHLKQPKIVKRGDEVVIEARSGSISVKAPGTALSDGYRNQQINVKNNLSNRVIKARVIDTGKVTAIM